jgi:hypothetical protein
MERHQIVEGVEIAGAGALDEDQIAALDGVVDDRRRAKVLLDGWIPPDGDWNGREARRV